MIFFKPISAYFLHCYLPPTFPPLSLGSHLPWLLLTIEVNARSCPLLTSTTGIPCRFTVENTPLTTTENKPWAVPPFQYWEEATCIGLEDQRYSSECVIAVCHVLRRFFLKLFWLFISHVLTSFACIHLFPLLNGSWCFTWRKAFFCESRRAFKTQFACEKSWS